jgi:hypothetical protein
LILSRQLKQVKNVPLSRVVSQEEFRVLRGISQQSEHSPSPTRGEEADKRNIYRRNFYVSKPFAELNKDFKYQSQLPSAQYKEFLFSHILILCIEQLQKILHSGSKEHPNSTHQKVLITLERLVTLKASCQKLISLVKQLLSCSTSIKRTEICNLSLNYINLII